MSAQKSLDADALAALRRRFHALVAAEVVAAVLAGLALIGHFALRLPGALAAFALVTLGAALLQVAFILAVRSDMKKDA